jgi:Uma2 family endonuclease
MFPQQSLPFREGDRLDRAEFHRLYEATTEDFRAELVNGTVYFVPPGTVSQGRFSAKLIGWLGEYQMATPGTEALANVTILLGEQSEPQPRAALLVKSEFGGRSYEDEEGHLAGSPELAIDVWSGLEKYSFDEKRRDYEHGGVSEYPSPSVPEQRITLLGLRGERYESLPSVDGVIWSRTFPGLWLDTDALLKDDYDRFHAVLAKGIASPAHADFVATLEAFRKTP